LLEPISQITEVVAAQLAFTYLPFAFYTGPLGNANPQLSSLRQRLAILGWRLAHVPFEDTIEVRNRLKSDFENDLAHTGIWV
jgi:hypothetical protein